MNLRTALSILNVILPVLNRAGVPDALRNYAASTDEQWDDIVAIVIATGIERGMESKDEGKG